MTTASDDPPSATVCDDNCIQWWCTCPCEIICCLCDDVSQSCAILFRRACPGKTQEQTTNTEPPEQIAMVEEKPTARLAVFVESANIQEKAPPSQAAGTSGR